MLFRSVDANSADDLITTNQYDAFGDLVKVTDPRGNAGYFYYDHVVGKHLLIDYAVAVDADGRVRKVEILNYRESYGGEVHDASWLQQFVGKSHSSAVQINSDIRNISGATLSSTHITEGVKKVLAYHASHFR